MRAWRVHRRYGTQLAVFGAETMLVPNSEASFARVVEEQAVMFGLLA